MKFNSHRLFGKVFKNTKGRVVISQFPNIPLWGWIVSTLLGLLFKTGLIHTGFHRLADAALVVWAYEEIRSGESLFRRILGAIALIFITYRFFSN